MAANVKNGVPYEVRINAVDLNSGKLLSNILYLKYYTNTLAYGDSIAGTTLDTVVANVAAVWTLRVTPNLSIGYKGRDITCRSITSRRFPTPFVGIVGTVFVVGTVTIFTSAPHGLSNGDAVSITQTLPDAILLGVQGPVTVINPTQFQFPYSGIAGTVTSGQVQVVRGSQEFVYTDQEQAVYTDAGLVGGDACPLFNSASVRRFNTGSGRNWRSRISLSPIAESSQVNGRFAGPYLTNIRADMNALFTTTISGGLQVLTPQAISRNLAFAVPTPFGESDTWTRPCTGGTVQPNLGSVVRRKPRLTAAIS